MLKGGRVSWTSDGAEAILFDQVDQVEQLLAGMEDQNRDQQIALAQVGSLMTKFDTVARSIVDPDRTTVGVSAAATVCGVLCRRTLHP